MKKFKLLWCVHYWSVKNWYRTWWKCIGSNNNRMLLRRT